MTVKKVAKKKASVKTLNATKTKSKKEQVLSSVDLHSVSIDELLIETDKQYLRKLLRISILDTYIFMEILNPFIVALSFFTMIYMVVALQKMIGLFLSKGVDIFRLLDYMGYVFGNTLPMTIPMACLMSGIMAAGRLSGDSEITAMRSAGISFPRIYRNFLFFGFIMSLIVAYLNFFLGPENTRKMKEFNNWIVTYNPLLAVNPGQFSGDKTQDLFKDKARTLYTEGVDSKTGALKGIQIREWDIELDNNNTQYFNSSTAMIPIGTSRILQIISAKKGRLIEKKTISGEYEKSIRLKEGFIIEWDKKKQGFTVTNFMDGEMDYNVPKETKSSVKKLEINIKPDTFSLPKLFSIRDSIQTEGLEKVPGLEVLIEMGITIKGISGLDQIVKREQMDIFTASQNKTLTQDQLTERYSMLTQMMLLLDQSKTVLTQFNVEIHKRIAMPISCQIFFFLSFPLGLVVKRSGKGMSFTLAVVFLLIYYTFFLFGSNLSYKSSVPDWLGPWSANIVISIISVYIMLTRTDVKIPVWLVKIFSFFMPLLKFFSYLYRIVIEKSKKLFKKNTSNI